VRSFGRILTYGKIYFSARQLCGDGFVWRNDIFECTEKGACAPRFAVIIAVKHANLAWKVSAFGLAEFFWYKPERKNKRPIFCTNSVARAERENVSVSGHGCGGYITRLAPYFAVAAFAVEYFSAAYSVILTIEKM
jgi:hypothetical protein